jgi:Protein of unknown function (DUF2950)
VCDASEEDLGDDTARIAERMSAINPDSSWAKVSDTESVK